jgi:hypothetical protein
MQQQQQYQQQEVNKQQAKKTFTFSPEMVKSFESKVDAYVTINRRTDHERADG